MLEVVGCMSVEQKLKFDVLTIFKIKNDMMPDYLVGKLRYCSAGSYCNFWDPNFVIHRCYTGKRYKTLFYRDLSQFNNRPVVIRGTVDLTYLKKPLRIYLENAV